MLNYINKIWNDDSLYGHCLTSLPSKMWDFANPDTLFTYTIPDPGTAERVFFIFEKYISTTTWANGNPHHICLGTNILLFKYSELGFRKITGMILSAGAMLTVAPIGFAIKTIQNTFA